MLPSRFADIPCVGPFHPEPWENTLIDALMTFPDRSTLAIGQDYLRARPAMERTEVELHTCSWGGWSHQFREVARGRCRVQDRTIVCLGRPSIRQSLAPATDDVAAWVGSQTPGGLGQHAGLISESLSGMYTIIEIGERSITVLTDRMGFRPFYVATDPAGRTVGAGSSVEALALVSGIETNFDMVSLGELLVHNFITFPFTTRERIRELPPCSLTTIDPASGACSSQVLWEPTEPKTFASHDQIADRLENALRTAADDITAGCTNAAVLLSGGFDSRLVLAALPKRRLGAALTYVTNQNRETRVAGEVARAAGVEQLLVQRGEDYFPGLVERGLGLLGMELRGNTHGLCLADNGLGERFDVIIGGQLSDTLLKDHFMPFAKRDMHAARGLRPLLRRLIKGPIPPRVVTAEHTTGRAQLETHLCPGIRDAVRARKAERMEAVRRVRPSSAEEWHRFWPCSRQDDSSHTLGNSRLTVSDTLFAHTDIVEVARDLSDEMRVDGRLADGVFMKICGPLASITNANTGLAANASRRALRAQQKKKRLDRQRLARSGDERTDWNAVENSWADPVSMQKNAQEWIRHRERLADSPALAVIDQLLDRSAARMISTYQDDLPSTTNHIAMQMVLWADTLLRENHPIDTGVTA